MLQRTKTGSENFICGVCIEAYSNNRYTEHFWIGGTGNIRETDVSSILKEINMTNEKNEPLSFRQFKNNNVKINIDDCATKQDNVKKLTTKLGVYERQPEVNPYLDSLTRSIGFKPLSSIDQFVCDYILE